MPVANEYSLPTAFYFKVRFPLSEKGDTSFQEVSGIKSEVETEPFNEGGVNRYTYHLPKSIKYTNLILKRGIVDFTSPLAEWCRSILDEEYFDPIQTLDIQVSLMNEAGEPVRVWNFLNAYPVSWEIDPFNSTKNELAIEKIELCYSYFNRAR